MSHGFPLLVGATALASLLLTAIVRRLAGRVGLVDRPNERSSHLQPTPRGGGLALLLCLVGAAIIARHRLPAALLAALLGSLWVGAIGLLDDLWTLRARWRLAAHLAAGCWLLWCLGGMPAALTIGNASWNWGWIGEALALVGIVWLINLYNFMDGIDGIAGVEAICVAGAEALLVGDALAGVSTVAWLVVAAVGGFVVWNWPPARIFMGDVGSGALGYLFAMVVVAEAHGGTMWRPLILLGCFVVDAMVTLSRRMLRGDRWYTAHRIHAYQHASRRWGHRPVTAAVGVLNVVWLTPVAWLSGRWPRSGPIWTLIAYLPLVCLSLWLGAGRPEITQSSQKDADSGRS